MEKVPEYGVTSLLLDEARGTYPRFGLGGERIAAGKNLGASPNGNNQMLERVSSGNAGCWTSWCRGMPLCIAPDEGSGLDVFSGYQRIGIASCFAAGEGGSSMSGRLAANETIPSGAWAGQPYA